MINRILNRENLNQAKENLLKKHDSCGVDGMRLSELEDYLQNNYEALTSSILDETYRPGLVQEVDIINNKGKIRTISKLTSVDRLILRAVHQILYESFSPQFSPSSFAYQENKGISTSARQAANYIEAEYS